MSRKGDWEMKIWMDRDIKCARLFNVVCNVSKDDAIKHSGISENRLNTWKNLGWITEEHDEKNTWYRTTKSGRDVFEEKTLVNGYISTSYKHDKGLFDVFDKCTEKEQDSWQTERELRINAIEQGISFDYKDKEVSVTDGAYLSEEGEWVYVEITTSNYTQEMKDMKYEFVSRMGGRYEEHAV